MLQRLRRCPASALAGLAQDADGQGWAAAGDRPFDGHLEDAAAEINRTMHGAARSLGAVRLHGIIGATTFRDAYRGSIAGRVVIVANAWTNIGREGIQVQHRRVVRRGGVRRGTAVAVAAPVRAAAALPARDADPGDPGRRRAVR